MILQELEKRKENLVRKKLKSSTYDDIDEAIFKWMTVMREKKLPLSGTLIKEKALEFGAALGHRDFQASNGWLEKFKKRHCVIHKVISGESASASVSDCETWKQTVLRPILEKYPRKDIFNADETGLFFKCLPNKTLTFKNDPCFGGKQSKLRITILVAANMVGTERLKMLVIGKSKTPRCFRGVKSLEVDYTFNKKAWMTTDIFTDWVKKLDKQITRQNRKIVLFIDNCTAHPQDINSVLNNVKVVFFPPNVTSILQPMDQGVIKNLKLHYRKRILKKITTIVENNQTIPVNIVDLRECISELSKVWTNDVSDETIFHCFCKAGFGTATTEWNEEDDMTLMQLKSYWNLLQTTGNVGNEVALEDFIYADEHVTVSDLPDDDDILHSVTKSSETLEEDAADDENCEDQQEERKPTDDEVLQSFKTIRLGLQLKDEVPDSMFEHLNKCEAFFERCTLFKQRKQQKITHFFK